MSVLNLGNAVINFLAYDAPFQEGIRSVEATMARLQYRFNQIGRAAESIIRVAGGALANSFQESSRFETSMAKVQTVMQRNTTYSGIFRKGIQDMSIEFGIATDQLSNSLYDVISAGVPAGKALDVVRQSALAAVGGMADMRITTKGVTAVMAAYQIDAKNVAAVTDQMYQAVIQGRLEFEDLANVMGYIAPLSYQAGVSLDTMLAALSAMTNTGASAQQAAVQWQGFIKAFIRPSKQSAAAAQAFGIELGAQSLQGERLFDTLEKLSKLPIEKLGRIFPDIRGARGALALTTMLQQFREFSAQMKTSSGATRRAFETMAQTPGKLTDRMKQGMLSLMRAVGDTIAPAVIVWMNRIQAIIPVARQWVFAHQEMIVAIVQWSAAVLGALVIVPRIIFLARTAVFAIRGVITSIQLAARVLIFAFANPLVAVAIVAVGLWIATLARSQIQNETWTQSAYAMARAVGLFNNQVQNVAEAMNQYAVAAKDADEAFAKFQVTQGVGGGPVAPVDEQVEAVNAAVEAQQKRLELMKRVMDTIKSGDVSDPTLENLKRVGEWLGGAGTALVAKYIEAVKKGEKPDIGWTDKMVEDQKARLKDLLKAQEDLIKKQGDIRYPTPDFTEFERKLQELEEGGGQVKVTVKPEFRSITDMFDVIQKAVFGIKSDPMMAATETNTKATKDNTEAIKMLAQGLREGSIRGGFVIGR